MLAWVPVSTMLAVPEPVTTTRGLAEVAAGVLHVFLEEELIQFARVVIRVADGSTIAVLGAFAFDAGGADA